MIDGGQLILFSMILLLSIIMLLEQITIRDCTKRIRSQDRLIEALEKQVTEEGNFLDRIVVTIKEELGGKDDDYVTVIITVLVGEEKDVFEAEASIDFSIDQDDLPCKSAFIKMSGWKDKKTEKDTPTLERTDRDTIDEEPEPEGCVSVFVILGDEDDRPIEEVIEEFKGIVEETTKKTLKAESVESIRETIDILETIEAGDSYRKLLIDPKADVSAEIVALKARLVGRLAEEREALIEETIILGERGIKDVLTQEEVRGAMEPPPDAVSMFPVSDEWENCEHEWSGNLFTKNYCVKCGVPKWKVEMND